MAMLTAARTLLLALILAASPVVAGADDLSDFSAAVERAELQYRIALRTLETAGRDETAAEVRLFRETWQDVIARLDSHRPTHSRATTYAVTMTEVDAALVGVQIVIDIGSREAARGARAARRDAGEAARAGHAAVVSRAANRGAPLFPVPRSAIKSPCSRLKASAKTTAAGSLRFRHCPACWPTGPTKRRREPKYRRLPFGPLPIGSITVSPCPVKSLRCLPLHEPLAGSQSSARACGFATYWLVGQATDRITSCPATSRISGLRFCVSRW